MAPADAIAGEEFGGDATSAGERRWILDPLDGTEYFLRGIPTWATMLALHDRDEPLVGVVSAPALGHRWWAARGQGAFCDGVRLQVSDTHCPGRIVRRPFEPLLAAAERGPLLASNGLLHDEILALTE